MAVDAKLQTGAYVSRDPVTNEPRFELVIHPDDLIPVEKENTVSSKEPTAQTYVIREQVCCTGGRMMTNDLPTGAYRQTSAETGKTQYFLVVRREDFVADPSGEPDTFILHEAKTGTHSERSSHK